MGGGTPAHFAHAFTSTDMCPIEVSNGRCLGNNVFECPANFCIGWESFARRDQPKKMMCLRYVALLNSHMPLKCGGDKCQAGVHELIPL